MIRHARPQQVIATAQPEIVHFDLAGGGALIGLFHPSGRGGGVLLLSETDADQVKAHVSRLLGEVARFAGCAESELQAKIAGIGEPWTALRQAVRELQVAVKGEHHARSASLTGYFYTETGRLRVQAGVPAAAPATPRVAPAGHVPAPAVSAGANPQHAHRRTRVLIVDDSRAVRQVLMHILTSDPEIEVVGELENPTQVLQKIEELQPDVLTLDIHMPDMNGLEVLERVLPKHPIPVVMISSISMEEGHQVLRALELGAVDYIQKPSFAEMRTMAPVIVERVRAAATVKVSRRPLGASPLARASGGANIDPTVVVAMGASTGGTEALKRIFLALPAEVPPIVVVQHIPPVFSTAFARRLNELCAFEVKEAEEGDVLKPGRVLIAPGGFHLKVTGKPGHYVAQITEQGPVTRHKPSVDVLFHSVAETVGRHSVGVILTGMGSDGAQGMLKMREAGARTLAQDEASCAVFGMPREAIRIGAAEAVHALDEMPEALLKLLRRKHAA